MEILGYAAAVLIGITLGLIGGGGSILAVPVLVYLMGMPPVAATGASLFIVGVTSLWGGVSYARRGLVAGRTALTFGVASVVAVYVVRRWVLPAVPETLFAVGGATVSRDALLMVAFALLMVTAALSMLRGGGAKTTVTVCRPPGAFRMRARSLGVGGLVGTTTGLVGVGGGFLIIPALVSLCRLPMRVAVGTSLWIIAAGALLGFAGDLQHHTPDWPLLVTFTALSVLGILIGMYLTRYVDGARLRRAFGWFVLVMGGFVLLQELL
ncbi:MAG: sulfite exporter TauE/SafE family protein [Catalinimonas sp.]